MDAEQELMVRTLNRCREHGARSRCYAMVVTLQGVIGARTPAPASMETLAARAGMDKHTVERGMSDLVRMGVVEATPRPGYSTAYRWALADR